MSPSHRLLLPLLALPLAALACLGEEPALPTALPTLRPTLAPPTATAVPPTATPTPVPAQSICDMVYADFNQLHCWQNSGAGGLIAEQPGLFDTIYNPQIAPNGKQVAYGVRYENGQQALWVVDIQTLDFNMANGLSLPRRQLVGGEQLPNPAANFSNFPHHHAWLADSRSLVFDTGFVMLSGEGGPGERINHDFWVANTNTGSVTPLVEAGQGGTFSVSPDRQWVAVSSPTALRLFKMGSSKTTEVLAFPNILTYSEYAYKPSVVWQPDSTAFTAFVPSADPMAADANATLYRVAVSDGAATPVLTVAGNFVFGGAFAVAPDGQKVLYTQILPDNSVDMYLAQASQATPTRLLTGLSQARALAWAPDSQAAAYAVSDAAAKGYVMLLSADGTQTVEVRIVKDQTFQLLGWAPDSAHLAFTSNAAGGLALTDRTGTVTPILESAGVTPLVWHTGALLYFLSADQAQTGTLYQLQLGQPPHLIAAQVALAVEIAPFR